MKPLHIDGEKPTFQLGRQDVLPAWPADMTANDACISSVCRLKWCMTHASNADQARRNFVD